MHSWSAATPRAGRPRRITPPGSRSVPLRGARPPVVIVADPDRAARGRVAELLRGDEVVVVEAEDGPGVARAAAEHDVDLVVVDADLPGASTLRHDVPASVPVVVTTRSPGGSADAVAAALDARGVLRKPVDEDDLRTIVWNLAVVR